MKIQHKNFTIREIAEKQKLTGFKCFLFQNKITLKKLKLWQTQIQSYLLA